MKFYGILQPGAHVINQIRMSILSPARERGEEERSRLDLLDSILVSSFITDKVQI
jgi:hypothetical protein